jgi:hypothetical protein
MAVEKYAERYDFCAIDGQGKSTIIYTMIREA